MIKHVFPIKSRVIREPAEFSVEFTISEEVVETKPKKKRKGGK